MRKALSLLPMTLILLTGCTPPAPPAPPQPAPEPLVFGVPESAWQTLSPHQKDEAIKAYNQQQQASIQSYNQQQQQNAQDAELQSALDAASNIITTAINKNNN